jgi:Ribonuclease G/E
MALESEEKIKVLDEHIEILKQDLFFSMAERKNEPANNTTHKINRIKQELDRAVQEKMTLSQIYYGIINKRVAHTAARV